MVDTTVCDEQDIHLWGVYRSTQYQSSEEELALLFLILDTSFQLGDLGQVTQPLCASRMVFLNLAHRICLRNVSNNYPGGGL
jgi:hypothetical protein